MTQLTNRNDKRVSININYVVSIEEHGPDTTEVFTVDGRAHMFKGSYEKVLKELSE